MHASRTGPVGLAADPFGMLQVSTRPDEDDAEMQRITHGIKTSRAPSTTADFLTSRPLHPRSGHAFAARV